MTKLPLSFERAVLSVARAYPFWRGRGVLAHSCVLRRVEVKPILVHSADGLGYWIYPNDYIGRMLYFFGDFDPAITNLVKRIVTPGDLAIDVGANIGVISIIIAKCAGSTGRVIAFEPGSEAREIFLRNISENSISNIEVHGCALSDKAGNGYLSVPVNSLGEARLGEEKSGQICQTSPLDKIDLHLENRALRLLKVDVEGHEHGVFAGAVQLFEDSAPEFVLFESHEARGRFWSRPEIVFLADRNYGLYSIRRGFRGRFYLDFIERGAMPQGEIYDYLAIRGGAGSCASLGRALGCRNE